MNTKEYGLYFDDIDIIKGVAILAVLWNHSFILYPINIHDLPWCHYARMINSTFFLIAFFLVSGFLFSGKRQSLLETVKSKGKRLLIPYLCYCLLNLLSKTIAPGLVNREIVSVWDYAKMVLFFGGELWFLYCLFLIITVFSLILPKFKYLTSLVLIILFLCVLDCSFINRVPREENYFLYTNFVHYSIFFIIGYVLRKLNNWRSIMKDYKFFIVVLLLYLIVDVYYVGIFMDNKLTRLLCQMLGGIFVWSFSFQVLRYLPKLGDAFSWCGKNSLGIYWLNGFCLVITRTLVVSVFHFQQSVLIAICVFLLTLIFEIVAICLVKRVPYLSVAIGV